MKKIKRVSAVLLAISSIVTVSACDFNKDNTKNDQEVIVDDNDNQKDKEKQTYVVTFITNGGSNINQVSVEEGNKISKPDDPTKEADNLHTYTFDGWFSNEALTDSFDFNTPINGNLNLYARWETRDFITVNFDTDGGSTITPVKIVAGNKISRPTTNPTKTSQNSDIKYEFDDWYTNTSYNTKFDFTKSINSTTTIYAKFNVTNKITVKFDTNGGSNINDIKILPGETITKPSNPTKTSSSSTKYEFAGWYSDSNLQTEFNFNNPINETTTIYAKWNETDKITVSFNTNGGTNIDDIKLFPGETINRPTTIPAKETDSIGSYTFDDWYTDNTFKTKFDFTKPITDSTTIYANYNITERITVSFDTNGGTSLDSIRILPGETVNRPTTIPTKAADSNGTYTFDNWYKDSACKTLFDFTEPITETTTIYAGYIVKNEVTIKFDTNGGSTISDVTIDKGGKVSKPADPTKATDANYKYEFAGWYADSNLQTEFNFNNTIDTSTTIYAKWNQISKITITFNSNGGSNVSSISVFPGEKITEPSDPQKATDSQYIYSFLGWYSDSNLQTAFNFNNAVTEGMTLYAKWGMTPVSADTIILSSAGYNEGAYVNFKVASVTNANNSTVSYSTDGINYTEIDRELIRYNSSTNTVRADILGLSSGSYLIKVYNGVSTEVSTTINVSADDRSGYAFYNNSNGVGAYDTNGNLKSGTVVVYVTEETKNTVTATIAGKTYTGLANILKNQSKSSVPLDIRIIGTIGAPTWNKIEYASSVSSGTSYTVGNTTVTKNGEKDYSISIKNAKGNTLTSGTTQENLIDGGYNTLDNSYEELNGLTSKITGSEGDYDTYWNMLDISSVKNVTVEGVGTDAIIHQWGFTWKSCSYIEVKNLTFNDYPEDACSFEAGDTSATTLDGLKTGYLWIHNNTFNIGKNNWDACPEQDKHEGDGATDFKGLRNVTISYNHYYKNHKTGLLGGDGKHHQANITFHHNWYQENQARLPYGRQANMHMYNNFYDSSTGTNMQIHDGGYAFIENCYFKNTKKTFEVKTNKTTQNPAIKSYNNIYDNCQNYEIDKVTITTNRLATVSNDCLFGSSFDTDSSLFYYDSTNKVSNVTIMNEASELPTLLPTITGAGTLPNFGLGSFHQVNPNQETFTVTFNTNGGTSISSQTVVSGNTITNVTTTKSNCTFKGWFTDSGLTKEFNVSTPITSDLTLYAKWEENSSSIEPTTGSTVYTFNNFSAATLSSNTTVGDLTVTIKSGKTTKIETTSCTIENTSITKFVSFGGGGSYSELSIQFALSKTSNVTVYYAGSSNGRYAALCDSSSNKTVSTVATTGTGSNNIVSYTFENVEAGSYAITSNNSSIEIYAIVIE